MMRFALALPIVFASLMLAGCAPSGSKPPRPFVPGVDQVGADAPWPFWPARMRIHPLTRMVDDEATSGRIFEARLEFTDASGHTTKAIGHLRLTLFDGPPETTGRELSSWNVHLWDLAVNANQFDDVSRTYLTRLHLDAEHWAAAAVLRAEFHSINGIDLQADHRLRR